MIKEITVFNLAGKKIGMESLDIDEKMKINEDVLHSYVVGYLANQRQGTASAKTKAEVSGSGKKPWRQKGTGRARVGTTRNPVWRHGGVAFGPKPRDYRQYLPVKMKAKALKDAIFSRVIDDKFYLFSVDKEISQPKTKIFTEFLKQTKFSDNKVLFVLDKKNEAILTLVKSMRNIKLLCYCYSNQLNPYQLLKTDIVIAQKEILPQIKGFLGVVNG